MLGPRAPLLHRHLHQFSTAIYIRLDATEGVDGMTDPVLARPLCSSEVWLHVHRRNPVCIRFLWLFAIAYSVSHTGRFRLTSTHGA